MLLSGLVFDLPTRDGRLAIPSARN